MPGSRLTTVPQWSCWVFQSGQYDMFHYHAPFTDEETEPRELSNVPKALQDPVVQLQPNTESPYTTV